MSVGGDFVLTHKTKIDIDMKRPFALLVNDLHIDKDNISEFNLNWSEALSVCKEHGIENMVIGGDLWTSRASQSLPVLIAVKMALLKAVSDGLFVTIANGNHCKVNQESVWGYSSIFSEYEDIDVVVEWTLMDMESGYFLLVIPYFPENGTFIERFEQIKATVNPRKVVLYIHEGIHGAISSMDLPNELPQDIFKDFHSVLVGHYHNRVKIKGTNIEYIGASRQHSFGEDEEKGYTILYDDATTEFVKNQANIRYKTIQLTYSQLDKISDGAKLLEKKRYKYRLRLLCSSDEIRLVDRKKLMEFGFDKIEFVTEKVTAATIKQTDIEEKFDKVGIQKEYLTFCEKNGIECKLGIEYLNKIN